MFLIDFFAQSQFRKFLYHSTIERIIALPSAMIPSLLCGMLGNKMVEIFVELEELKNKQSLLDEIEQIKKILKKIC